MEELPVVPDLRLKPSRFNVRTTDGDGNLILYNSYTGAVGVVDKEEKETALSLLKPTGGRVADVPLKDDLLEGGFLVPQDVDEFQKAAELRESAKRTSDVLQLIIMPSEACNFRCVYCYESFQRGKMLHSVQEGLKALVRNRAGSINQLNVQWFGGEPTAGLDVIENLSREFLSQSGEYNFQFSAGMTTNGFNLSEPVVDLLLSARVVRYQITIDGPKDQHDRRRKLMGGGGSFEQIMGNLRAMHARPLEDQFSVALRVNFDRESKDDIRSLIELFHQEFDGDPRFQVYFRPVGQWGGPNDAALPVCAHTEGETAMWDLHQSALDLGLPIALLHGGLMPGGSVCYAALPYSFVIGANGGVYKCTVALDDERNRVGRVTSAGEIELDEAKHSLWVDLDEAVDPSCTPCFFRPACQGARCPWIRIKDNETPCPPTKKHIKRVLNLVAAAPPVDAEGLADMD